MVSKWCSYELVTLNTLNLIQPSKVFINIWIITADIGHQLVMSFHCRMDKAPSHAADKDEFFRDTIPPIPLSCQPDPEFPIFHTQAHFFTKPPYFFPIQAAEISR